MDQREKQFQSLNICHRLYHLMKFLARHAHKTIISSSPMPRRIARPPAGYNEASSESSQMVQPMAQATPPHEGEQAKTSSNANEQDIGGKRAPEIERIGASSTVSRTQSEENKKPEEEATLPPNVSQSKAPKKMVSINEKVETIKISKKKSKKKKEEQEMSDDSKPLKSILKVASDVNNNSDSQSQGLSRANAA